MFCQENDTLLMGTYSTIFFSFIQDEIHDLCMVYVNYGLGCNGIALQREADEVEQLPSSTEDHC